MQINLANFFAYTRFCRSHREYYECWGNQIRIMDWIDDRRIEMMG